MPHPNHLPQKAAGRTMTQIGQTCSTDTTSLMAVAQWGTEEETYHREVGAEELVNEYEIVRGNEPRKGQQPSQGYSCASTEELEEESSEIPGWSNRTAPVTRRQKMYEWGKNDEMQEEASSHQEEANRAEKKQKLGRDKQGSATGHQKDHPSCPSQQGPSPL